MIFKRLYDSGLSQASYLIGCQLTDQALVVDPNRDTAQYVRQAEREGLRLTHVVETHIHADFVSGARELARRIGAKLLLSAEGGPDWSYAYAEEDGATLLKGGDSFDVGRLKIDVLHTPGHTPEHLSFLVTDTASASEPIGMFSGDFIFVGDVGRPDLLEKAARQKGTMVESARVLYRSIQSLDSLPDYLQIWPGHGAGSACGKSLGAMPQSTLGYERRFNWAFGCATEEEFVEQVLAGQPDPPTYFAEMKRINREGPPMLDGFNLPATVPADQLSRVLEEGATVIDARPGAEFASGFVPGTISLPLGGSFAKWAGWLLPYDRDLYLIADLARKSDLETAVRSLAMIGLDRVAGVFGTDALKAWTDSGRRLETVAQITPAELTSAVKSDGVRILDVRNESEYAAGHIPGVLNIPLGELPARLAEISEDAPLVVHCQGGSRAGIAASLLAAHGVKDVRNLAGGYRRWAAKESSADKEGD